MPQMGSTQIQEVTERQGVRRQGEEASRRTKQQENQEEEPTKQRNQPSRGNRRKSKRYDEDMGKT